MVSVSYVTEKHDTFLTDRKRSVTSCPFEQTSGLVTAWKGGMKEATEEGRGAVNWSILGHGSVACVLLSNFIVLLLLVFD